MYSISTHKNFWEVERKWKDKYGEDSFARKKYVAETTLNKLRVYSQICGDDNHFSTEIVQFIKSHPESFK